MWKIFSRVLCCSDHQSGGGSKSYAFGVWIETKAEPLCIDAIRSRMGEKSWQLFCACSFVLIMVMTYLFCFYYLCMQHHLHYSSLFPFSHAYKVRRTRVTFIYHSIMVVRVCGDVQWQNCCRAKSHPCTSGLRALLYGKFLCLELLLLQHQVDGGVQIGGHEQGVAFVAAGRCEGRTRSCPAADVPLHYFHAREYCGEQFCQQPKELSFLV